MSRINGRYKPSGSSIEALRVLDTDTGELFDKDGRRQNRNFKAQADGTWSNGVYTWVPDAALAADWYVIRLTPDDVRGRPPRPDGYPDLFTSFGPYTEEEARKNAALRSEKSAGRDGRRAPQPYAVVQVQAGNTVVVQPPAPPSPVTIWS